MGLDSEVVKMGNKLVGDVGAEVNTASGQSVLNGESEGVSTP